MKNKGESTITGMHMRIIQIILCVIGVVLLKKIFHLSWLASILLGVPAVMILTWVATFITLFILINKKSKK